MSERRSPATPSAPPAPAAGIRAYRLGCPMWALADWQGSLYRAGAGAGGWLEQYARVFTTVEGNTTFYAVPAQRTVARWLEQTPEDFRFCFKFPRSISHDAPLARGVDAAQAFLHRMLPLGPRLGPFMLQLPARVGPSVLEALARFLSSLPSDVACAVEFRHRSFFDDDVVRDEADALLREHDVDRVILDSRPLRSGDQHHPDVLAAEHRKPALPVSTALTARRPLLRLICHPQDDVTLPWFDRWQAQLVRWLLAGCEPHVLIHCPNNAHSPRFARAFHRGLQALTTARGDVDVGSMPVWPGEQRGEQLPLL